MARIDPIEALNSPPTYYTASLSPYIQGAEIVTVGQLLNSLQVKIRGNISLQQSLSGVVPGYLNSGNRYSPFNDTLSPQNLGKLLYKTVDVFTVGRFPVQIGTGSDGTPIYQADSKSRYVTFLSSGSFGIVPTGSIRSLVGLDTPNRFDTYVVHQIEQRDLGQSSVYDDVSPFQDPDPIQKDPTIIIQKDPESLVISAELVTVSTPASFDGVMEAMPIRSLSDRTLLELPQVSRGFKGSLTVTDVKEKSYVIETFSDIRQAGFGKGASPFLDYVSTFGSLDQPGAFSDAPESLAPFSDQTSTQAAYQPGVVDSGMIDLFIQGITSGSKVYGTPDINFSPTYVVAARAGFVFSQNDNYGYDSIAFGGLKK